MLNSAAAGRRLALRVVAVQALATLLTALACLMIGPRAALAALAGGGAMTLGSLGAAWGAFGGGVVGAGTALGRLLLGTAVPEFFESYYLGRVTWFRALNRAVSAAGAIAHSAPASAKPERQWRTGIPGLLPPVAPIGSVIASAGPLRQPPAGARDHRSPHPCHRPRRGAGPGLQQRHR